MSCNIYLAKVHNYDNDSFKYGVYAIEESRIELTLEHRCISNVTFLSYADLIEKAKEEYSGYEKTDTPSYYDTPFLLNYLHKKHYLEPNVQDIYVSPLAAYHILRDCFEIEEQKQCDDTYDLLFGREDDEDYEDYTQDVPF